MNAISLFLGAGFFVWRFKSFVKREDYYPGRPLACWSMACIAIGRVRGRAVEQCCFQARATIDPLFPNTISATLSYFGGVQWKYAVYLHSHIFKEDHKQMHTPTYAILMFFAAIFGAIKLIFLWNSNGLLFTVSVFVLLITIYGTWAQLSSVESFEFKWMLWYTIPIGLGLVGQLIGVEEIQNHQLQVIGLSPIESSFPGTSGDYLRAANSHYLAMIYPLGARFVASLVGLGKSYFKS